MPTTNTTSLTMTPREASQYLGIGKTKCLDLLRTGRIKSVSLDGRIRVLRTACDKFLADLPRYKKGEPIFDNGDATKDVRKPAKRKAVRR